MEQVGLALQRLHPVEFLVALVTLETIRINEGPEAAIHIVVDPDTVARTAGDLKVLTVMDGIAKVGCLGIRAKTVVLPVVTRRMVAGVRMTNRRTRMLIFTTKIKNDSIGLLTRREEVNSLSQVAEFDERGRTVREAT